MKRTKIKKSMLAIPELLRQCLLSSLLYKLTPPLSGSPTFFLSPLFHPPIGVFFSKPTFQFLFTSQQPGFSDH